MVFQGSCRCGKIEIKFETTYTREKLPLRACQCSFCRSHGAVTAADPHGKITISIPDSWCIEYFRFGLRTADFLICKGCGNYIGALLEHDGRKFATVNTNLFEELVGSAGRSMPVSYDSDSAEERIQRRLANWTPATLVIAK